MEEVAPGLLRLPLRTPTLPPATTTNTLVVFGDDAVVIEPATPFADEQARLATTLDDLGAKGHPLVAILLTHHHPDHIGHADALRAARGVPIMAHEATAARVPFAIDRLLADGDRVELGDGVELRAVFTPGHAPGHLVYVEERSGVAYVGDMVAGEGTILVDPYDGGDMAQYLDSLRRVKSLRAAALVPAHGPVLRDPDAILDHYVNHRLAREAKIVAALEGGPLPMAELVARAYDDTPPFLWPLAERSAEAHLRKLVVDARVTSDADTWRLTTD
jgi:ribonuclease/clavin/mitogillin